MSLSAILGVTGLISALGGAGMNAWYRSKAADEVKKANDKISQNFAKQENEINKLPDNYLDTLQGRVAAKSSSSIQQRCFKQCLKQFCKDRFYTATEISGYQGY